MAKAWAVEGGVGYICPACRTPHVVPVGPWRFNGNYESPSFDPSMDYKTIKCHASVIDGVAHFADDDSRVPGQHLPLLDKSTFFP